MSAPIETTLTRLARVLTGEKDIDVIVRADGPRVEARCIVLPEIAHADDDVLTGYVDLFAACVKYGDAGVLNQMNEPVSRKLAQSIDDRRACIALLAKYPGSRRNLARVREIATREKACQWHELAWRDRLLWLIDRVLWDEPPTPNECSPSLFATLNACEA